MKTSKPSTSQKVKQTKSETEISRETLLDKYSSVSKSGDISKRIKTKPDIKASSSTPNVIKLKNIKDAYNIKKKIPVNKTVSPMIFDKKAKDVLASGDRKTIISQSKTIDSRVPKSVRTAKDLPFVNVTVTTPPSKKRNVNSTANTYNRERCSTRTLETDEIKILKPDTIDNNESMERLRRALNVAHPKSFFVDLNDENCEASNEYEDDFDSYESDFDSYRSSDKSEDLNNNESNNSSESIADVSCSQNTKDDEKMLDSGNFELKDTQKSADFVRSTLDNIKESVYESSYSLTDEGFIESNSLNNSNVDVMERISFSSYASKKRNSASYWRRAREIKKKINMEAITVTLFDLPPIAYATFIEIYGSTGKSQKAVQTFDDGKDISVQTDELNQTTKWTQKPIHFSNHAVCYSEDAVVNEVQTDFKHLKYEFVAQDAAIVANNNCVEANHIITFIEQRNGSGEAKRCDRSMVVQKLLTPTYDLDHLKYFLKKNEGRIVSKLRKNASKSIHIGPKSTISFADSFFKHKIDESILKDKFPAHIRLSDDLNYILTVHNDNWDSESFLNVTFSEIWKKSSCLCVWDIPFGFKLEKVCIALNSVSVVDYHGNCNGLIAAALEDGCMYIWDLSLPSPDVFCNSDITGLRHSAYCSCSLDETVYGRPIAIKFDKERDSISDTKIYLLYEHGTITIWKLLANGKQTNVSQPIKFTLTQTSFINIYNYIDNTSTQKSTDFNLSQAKKRTAGKKNPNVKLRRSIDSDITDDSVKMALPSLEMLDNGLLCTDLALMPSTGGVERFLIAKNCGEVLLCVREYGGLKIRRHCVCEPNATVTSITLTPENKMEYILAGSDTGYVRLYSLAEERTLLTIHARSTKREVSDRVDRIKRIFWRRDMCTFIVLTQGGHLCYWNLVESDIYATVTCDVTDMTDCVSFGGNDDEEYMVAFTKDGIIELHRLKKNHASKQNSELFSRYLSLL